MAERVAGVRRGTDGALPAEAVRVLPVGLHNLGLGRRRQAEEVRTGLPRQTTRQALHCVALQPGLLSPAAREAYRILKGMELPGIEPGCTAVYASVPAVAFPASPVDTVVYEEASACRRTGKGHGGVSNQQASQGRPCRSAQGAITWNPVLAGCQSAFTPHGLHHGLYLRWLFLSICIDVLNYYLYFFSGNNRFIS
jgi:hypothetical protein